MSARQSPALTLSAPARSNVLCIEDDPIVQLMLRDIVSGAGAQCMLVGTAREAEATLADMRFDVVVLDRRLPDSDGLLLLQSIKDSSDCPVVVLSAMDQTRDKLLGLGLGATEYVTKPFNPLELSSRIRHLLNTHSDGHGRPENDVLELAGMRFNPRNRRLESEGAPIILAPAESRLLHLLMLNEGEVQTRDQLSQFACGRDWTLGDRTVDVLINRLRRRLRAFPLDIVTIHRMGYLLVAGNKSS